MYKTLPIFVLFCALLTISTQDTVKVSIYYEALCTDSSAFITQQLAPNYDQLSNFIDVNFVPYGKATHVFVDDHWHFECQNWEDECYGNKVQGCALSQTEDQRTKVEFIACVMGSYYPAGDFYMEECAVRSDLSWPDIVECVKSDEGIELMVQNGDETHAIEPPITFVPTIIYNDVYDADLQESSLTDFLGTVLTLIEN